jgi:uncharacterized membrane protein YdcZ (DUF606 family)
MPLVIIIPLKNPHHAVIAETSASAWSWISGVSDILLFVVVSQLSSENIVTTIMSLEDPI